MINIKSLSNKILEDKKLSIFIPLSGIFIEGLTSLISSNLILDPIIPDTIILILLLCIIVINILIFISKEVALNGIFLQLRFDLKNNTENEIDQEDRNENELKEITINRHIIDFFDVKENQIKNNEFNYSDLDFQIEIATNSLSCKLKINELSKEKIFQNVEKNIIMIKNKFTNYKQNQNYSSNYIVLLNLNFNMTKKIELSKTQKILIKYEDKKNFPGNFGIIYDQWGQITIEEFGEIKVTLNIEVIDKKMIFHILDILNNLF